MKTKNDVLTDIYKIVKASAINDLNGGVYKQTRDTDSVLQDCVISLIGGDTAKFIQDGALYVKLFYADINYSNTYVEDLKTCSIMEGLLYDLSNTLLKTNGYSFQVQSRQIYSEAVEETNQHYAILKINFQNTL